jgi:hypothetical protein
MDVDKPSQLELLRADLARQQSEALSKPKRTVRKTATKTGKPGRAAKAVRARKSTNGTKKTRGLKVARNKVKEEN